MTLEKIRDFLYQRQLYKSPTELCFTMQRYGSDKGLGHHNYTTLYHHLFQDIRGTTRKMFELGLGSLDPSITSNMCGFPTAVSCGSLRGWRSYFGNAHVYGADIDPKALAQEDRLSTYICDQTDPVSIAKMWANFPDEEDFDIIIDDGLHTFQANITFFEHSIHKLKKGGCFIIEDILRRDVPAFQDYLKGVEGTYEFSGIVDIPNPQNMEDNILIVLVK